MNWQSALDAITDVGVIAVIIGGAFALVTKMIDVWTNRRRSSAETHKIEAETEQIEAQTDATLDERVAYLRKSVDGLLMDREKQERENIVQLRRISNLEIRQQELEQVVREKDVQLTKKQLTIDDLSARLEALESKVDAMRKQLRKFQQWADERGYTDYPPVDNNLLDTDPKGKGKK